ncbi:MAG: CPBP family intramembrane metalloprotease [Spirochaetales bacterium]|nr:CPBP family intramembrane metalloprotease [Spirochaetales bacterium]
MKRKLFEIILLFIIFFPFTLTITSMMTSSEQINTAELFNIPYFISYILMTVPQLLLLGYIIIVSKQPLADFGIVRPQISKIGWVALGVVCALAIAFWSSLIATNLPEGIRDIVSKKQIPTVLSPQALVVSFFFCVLVGYKEEFFFRSYLFTRLQEMRLPVWAAVLAASVIFGSLHFYQGIMGIFVTMGIGFIFQWLYIQTRNLHVVAAAHALYNFSLFLLAFLLKDFLPELSFLF